jgi:hypothetical protein
MGEQNANGEEGKRGMGKAQDETESGKEWLKINIAA